MMRGTAGMRLVLGILSPLFLVLCVVAIWNEGTRPWVDYQEQFLELFRSRVAEKLAEAETRNDDTEKVRWRRALEEAGSVRPALAQIYLEDIKVADRCTTCHKGVDNPLFEDAPLPFRTHPGKLLEQHDPNRFGCTVCHQGQGAATTVEGGHGHEPNWSRPLLPHAYVQASCGRCHEVTHGLAGAEEVTAGGDLFLERGCYACHDVPGIRYLPKFAPPLAALATKLSAPRDWAYAWVKDPAGMNPDTAMPGFILKDDEAGKITAFLLSLPAPEPYERVDLSGASTTDGEQLFTERGCRACHGVKSDEKSVSRRVPHLGGIGSKVTGEWLDRWIADPKKYNADTAMPKIDLTEEERRAVVAYLLTLERAEPVAAAPDIASFDPAKGKDLVRRYECFGCHAIPGFEKTRPSVPKLAEFARKPLHELDFGRTTDVPHSKWDWLDRKLREPRAYESEQIVLRMPETRLTEEERRRVISYVLAFDVPTLPARYVVPATDGQRAWREQAWMVAHLNCSGCHRLGEDDPHVARYFERKNLVPPSLKDVGARLQGQYMYQFLMEPTQVRPWMTMRMPAFGLDENDARTLVAGFAARDGVTNPHTYAASQKISEESFQRGVRRFRHYKCVQCHPTSVDEGLPEDVDPEDLSINLMLAKTRLRPEWIRDFMERPKQIAGNQTRMPTVFYTVDGIPKVERPVDDINDITVYMMGMVEPPEVTLAAEEERRQEEKEKREEIDWSTVEY